MKPNLFLMLCFALLLASCYKGAFYFNDGDDDGPMDGFTIEGIFNDRGERIETCAEADLPLYFPHWENNTNWNKGGVGGDEADNKGSLFFYTKRTIPEDIAQCFPHSGGYWLVKVTSPLLEENENWQDISGYTAKFITLAQGITVQPLVHVRTEDGRETYFRMMNEDGTPTMYEIDHAGTEWTVVRFTMSEPATVLNVVLNVFGDAEITYTWCSGDCAVYIDAMTPAKRRIRKIVLV